MVACILVLGQDTPYAVVMRIERFIINEGYNSRNNENDIALVKTQNVIQFSSNVGPICLPFRSSGRTFVDEVVTALGKYPILDFRAGNLHVAYFSQFSGL